MTLLELRRELNEPVLTDDVLEWVNETRASYGIGPQLTELPKAVPHNSKGCVIAKSLDAVCGNYEVFLNGKQVQLPEFVRQFIQDFDAGKLPELEEGQR